MLQEEERERAAFENVAGYIALNPERKRIVESGRYRDYPFTGCLVPGYPELVIWQPDYWDRFWRIYSYLERNGLLRGADDSSG